jgi:hypothetical protein
MPPARQPQNLNQNPQNDQKSSLTAPPVSKSPPQIIQKMAGTNCSFKDH